MTTAADQAAAALKASIGINQAQQHLTEESRLLLAALLRGEMRDAVFEGITEALTDEAAERFWNKGLEVLQRQAAERTGRWLVGGLMAMLKKAAWVGVFMLIVWSVGGFALLKTVWIATTKGAP